MEGGIEAPSQTIPPVLLIPNRSPRLLKVIFAAWVARRKAMLPKAFLPLTRTDLRTDLLHYLPERIPLYNIIELGNQTEAERPFKDLLNQLFF